MGGRQSSGKAEVADETAGKVIWGLLAAQDIAFSTWDIAFSTLTIAFSTLTIAFSTLTIAFSTWDNAFSTRDCIRVLLNSGRIT